MMKDLIVLILMFCLYFLPAIIAGSRKVKSSTQIFVTNLFFGRTILGWLICLVWAFSPSVVEKVATKSKAKKVSE